MAVMTDEERCDFHRKSRRRETANMIFQAAVILLAVVSLILLMAGGSVPTAAWLVLVAIQAVASIYAQRTIRLLRETNREVQERCHWLQEQWHAAVTRIFN